MVLMKYFCFCVPVRLGVIISSVFTIIENLIVLIGISMFSAEDIASYADSLTDQSKENSYDASSKEMYEILSENVKDYAAEYRNAFIIIYIGCIVACIASIFSAMTKKRWFSIPFIITRFIQIFIIFIIHVNCMLYMKKYWNLGILIFACCSGGFLILLLLYLWGVAVAMFQMIGIVNSKKYKAMIQKELKPIVVVRKPRNEEISSIAANIDNDNGVRMVASDFYGIHKKHIRRI